MFRIRESSTQDFEQVLALAKLLNSYNLPNDPAVVSETLANSEAAFRGEVPIADRTFMFVLEDLDTDALIGTCSVYAQHGTKTSPHVYLDVTQAEHYSDTLGKYMVHQCLRLGFDYNGPTEIGGLILLPEYRGHQAKLGKLLSFSRFLFIAMHREIFRDDIISELLPLLEADGTSKLWKHFGARFTGLTYQEADRLSKDNKEFIKSLFPHGLVYTALFPEDVQRDIGVVGPSTKGVEKMLKSIGFEYNWQIDPFDGGPHLLAETDKISLVAGARTVSVADVDGPADLDNRVLLASTPEPGRFRCVWATVTDTETGVVIDAEGARALEAKPGDSLCMVIP